MYLNEIYKSKHELWLKILFSSFAIANERIKTELYDIAQIEFRHLKWLSNRLRENNIEYSYEKDEIDIQKKTNFEYFQYLIDEIQSLIDIYDKEDVLFARMFTDETFFVQKLKFLLAESSNDGQITAFNKERIYENKQLDKTSTDALTLFLFEETYKEYELILIYAYMQNHTEDIVQYNVYQDLIDESQFHLKSFGNMLSKMGILAIPRMLIESLYKRDDIRQFLVDGIDEEKAAKEECRKLSLAVKDEELSKFFEFINFQENYHIELMQKVIKVL